MMLEAALVISLVVAVGLGLLGALLYRQMRRRNNHVVAATQLKELKSTIAGKEKEVSKLSANKQKELDKYLKEKKTTSSGLDKELIYKFEKIVKNKDGIGIISIKNNVCMGCNVLLPHQFVNDVRREEQILFCPNCSRILYYQHEDLAEEIAFQP